MSTEINEFGFGLEAEFLLCDSTTFEPIDLNAISAQKLQAILQRISVNDIPLDGLAVKPLHNNLSHYMVEGYYLTDNEMNKLILLPKGIEIMTPVAQTVSESVQDLAVLYSRLNNAMAKNNLSCSILSHHPTAPEFFAAPNYERHDYWQWALTAMTTYGPDVNISIPTELSAKIENADMMRKVNYYMPAVCALSFASPLTEGKLWKKRNQVGKSIRTHRRSIWAPLFYVHETPALRYEFKGFEMANDLQDYEAYFLLSLAILLDETMKGRASDQTRIYDLGELAFDGLRNDDMRQRAEIVLRSASRIASRLGIADRSLSSFWNRLDRHYLPADEIIETYLRHSSVSDVLRERSYFRSADMQLTKAGVYVPVTNFAPPLAMSFV